MDGTQIDAPLHAVFNQAKRNNMPRQILLLTDGDVSNPQQVIQLVAKNRKLNRLHTIGIGSGVSEQLVKKCA
jgi:Ca-activated chloride channel family protein